MRHRALAFLIVVFALLLTASGAVAGGNGAQTTTAHEHKATDTFVDLLPCAGVDPYTITITYNAVEHETITANGVHATFTQTGTFTAVPTNPSQLAFSGHFTNWGNFNLSPQNVNSTFTFTIHGTSTDGSGVDLHFHETAHFTASGDPLQVRVEFDKVSCA